jgi:predicted enzyme related to lactoylglutathione lyase
MAGEPSFFEIGVQDAQRGRAFYEGLFGWRMEPFGAGFAVTTAGVQGGIHGDDQGASPYLFFAVDDMDAALERVRRLGGNVDEADHEDDEESIGRFGKFKFCRDDQGSPFGLHEPPGARRPPGQG